MKRNNKGFTLVEFVFVVLTCVIIIGGVFGWVNNIVELTRCDFKAPYKTEVIRIVGIIPPVGAIVGWMELEDK